MKRIGSLLCYATLGAQLLHAAPLGTAFSYQGRLASSGQPAQGTYDFRFAVYDADTGSGLLAGPVTNAAIEVMNGLFTVNLDFRSGLFDGSARWLEIGVRTNGSTEAFTVLSPRQELSPSPQALYASSAGRALSAATADAVSDAAVTTVGILDGSVLAADLAAGQVVKSLNTLKDDVVLAAGPEVTITPAGNTLTVSGSADWKLGGNAGTTPATDFVGTTDRQALELRVNNLRALRLEPNTNGAPNVIGGAPVNFVTPGAIGATIGGGGALDSSGSTYSNTITAWFGTISGGEENTVNASTATIGGGAANTIEQDAWFAVISGGVGNTIDIWAPYSTLGGGERNLIGQDAIGATIAGGTFNTNRAQHGSIGGGFQNAVGGYWGTISGGGYNSIGDGSSDASIAGGYDNRIGASTSPSAIGGGRENRIADGSRYNVISGGLSNAIPPTAVCATIPGGFQNTATSYCFAAGQRASATNVGTFVWADSTEAPFGSATTNEFAVRATGSARFVTGVDPSGIPVAGVSLAAGSGSWSTLCDRYAKEHFEPADGQDILSRVATLPIQTWSYQSQNPSIRHIGPVAQDFFAAFQVGEDDRHISTVDADGVALAAIQGLNRKVEADNASLRSELRAKETRITELEHRLQRVERLLEPTQ
jgi:hypothetical protein